LFPGRFFYRAIIKIRSSNNLAWFIGSASIFYFNYQNFQSVIDFIPDWLHPADRAIILRSGGDRMVVFIADKLLNFTLKVKSYFHFLDNIIYFIDSQLLFKLHV